MANEPLTTYLRTYRRRSGFSQDEIAFLLGGMTGATVSRHENGERIPLLANAMMYEIVFGVPMREIYPTIYVAVQGIVFERARGMRNSIRKEPASAHKDHRLAVLGRLLEDEELLA
jgi:transcriptional regulator with XRE-family HTH domain